MKTRRDFLKLAGAAMVSAAGVASASENPFGFTKMESGYTQVAMEGKCGGNKPAVKQPEGSCGGVHKQSVEGSCGGNKPAVKQPEGSCGGMQKQGVEGSCGAKERPKATEGKCGAKS